MNINREILVEGWGMRKYCIEKNKIHWSSEETVSVITFVRTVIEIVTNKKY